MNTTVTRAFFASKLKRDTGRTDIAAYLTEELSEDVVITRTWVEQCDRTAQDLLDWYAQSDAPR